MTRSVLSPVCSVLWAVAWLGGLSTGAPGQESRPQVTQASSFELRGKLQEPLVYLSRWAPRPGEGDVMPVLNDPALQDVLGLPASRNDAATKKGSSRAVMRVLGKLLTRQSDALELALVSLEARFDADGQRTDDLPRLVFRSQMPEATVAGVRKILGTTFERSRVLHGHQVYSLKSSGASALSFEVTIIGRDFIATNHRASMEQVLSPRTRAGGKALQNEAEFRNLRRRLDLQKSDLAGSVMVYANLDGLRLRLPRLFGVDGEWLIRSSGLGQSDRLMLVARPQKSRNRKGGIVTSIVWSKPGSPDQGQHESDGWLDLVKTTTPRQLVPGLGRNGLAAISVQIEPAQLLKLRHGPVMGALQARLFRMSSRLGLDIQKQILRRLGKIGTAQLVFVPRQAKKGDPKSASQMPGVAYSVQAKSRTAAQNLFDDLRRALVRDGLADLHKGKGGSGILEVRSSFPRRGFGPGPMGGPRGPRFPRRQSTMFLTVLRSALVVADDRAILQRLSEQAGQGASLPRWRTAIQQRIASLGVRGKQVGAVFAFDLGRLADISRDLRGGGEKKKDTHAQESVDGLFGVHAGYLTVDDGCVRMEVFTVR